MKTIAALTNGIRQFLADVESGRITQGCFTLNEKDIIALNTEKQLFTEGKNALGVSIASYEPYSDVTLTIKAQKGQPTDRVTLRDTQAFHNSFFIFADNKAAYFKATDKKAQKLYDRYGQIFGLTNESKNIVIWEMLYPMLMAELKSHLLWQSQ